VVLVGVFGDEQAEQEGRGVAVGRAEIDAAGRPGERDGRGGDSVGPRVRDGDAVAESRRRRRLSL
jgi:hypothetical protein